MRYDEIHDPNEIRKTIKIIQRDNRNVTNLTKSMENSTKNCFVALYNDIRDFGLVRYFIDTPLDIEGIAIYMEDEYTRRD